MSISIYIVDDDDAVRESLQILLDAHGYAVRVFAGGPEFLAAYGQDPVTDACLVLDMNMPVMSGLEVLRAVRLAWPRLPVIIITGRAENVAVAEAEADGADRVLEKPFKDVTLIAAIEDAVARVRAR